jgi:hypothetical protein
MAAVLRDRVWAGGRLTTAAYVGISAGLAIAALTYAWTGSFTEAANRGVITGILTGAWTAYTMWLRWPQAERLAPDDRVAVARTVRTGADIGDARLAAAVADYAGVVRREHESALRRSRWLAPLAIVVIGGSAVALTVAGDTREAVVTWVLTAWTVVVAAWWEPRKRARGITNARHAETARRWAVDA